MNWGEFKKLLESHGVTDLYEIDYLELDWGDTPVVKTRTTDGKHFVSVTWDHNEPELAKEVM